MAFHGHTPKSHGDFKERPMKHGHSSKWRTSFWGGMAFPFFRQTVKGGSPVEAPKRADVLARLQGRHEGLPHVLQRLQILRLHSLTRNGLPVGSSHFLREKESASCQPRGHNLPIFKKLSARRGDRVGGCEKSTQSS